MRLNQFERLLINSPLRLITQRFMDVPYMKAMGGEVPAGQVLEVGCGRGMGIVFIFEHFGAARVDGFDLDPEMVALARRRFTRRPEAVRLWVGDATRMAIPDETYDAVFDFGIIHHIPAWRESLVEVRRVLKPGGRFYAFEVMRDFILHPLWRRLMDHPLQDRFNHDDFVSGLQETGFVVQGSRTLRRDFAWFVAHKK